MTKRLTMAQGIVAFLKNQYSSRDGKQTRFFEGCFGIFGHGNVAGMGQALEQDAGLRYYLCRNEQAMVHTAAAFAKTSNRLRTLACTTSIGPGATNMVASHNQPAPGASLAGGHFCAQKRCARSAATRVRQLARYFRERLLQTSLQILGPHQPRRSTPRRTARSHAPRRAVRPHRRRGVRRRPGGEHDPERH